MILLHRETAGADEGRHAPTMNESATLASSGTTGTESLKSGAKRSAANQSVTVPLDFLPLANRTAQSPRSAFLRPG
jgi:hypothetical protein